MDQKIDSDQIRSLVEALDARLEVFSGALEDMRSVVAMLSARVSLEATVQTRLDWPEGHVSTAAAEAPDEPESLEAADELETVEELESVEELETAEELELVADLEANNEVGTEESVVDDVDEEALREEVRRAVEQTKAELQSVEAPPKGIWAAWNTDAAEGSFGGAVRESGWPGLSESHDRDARPANGASAEHHEAEDEDPERQDIRRLVEQTRSELAQAGMLDDTEAQDEERDIAAANQASDSPDAGIDPRELVRLEERARAELASGRAIDIDRPEHRTAEEGAAAAESAMAKWEPKGGGQRSSSVAPMIVIEDPDGRIELVRIYDTLDRINCSEFATLLNYSPHNVAIGIGLHPAPEINELVAAVTAAFDRPCEILSDGERLAVRINSAMAA